MNCDLEAFPSDRLAHHSGPRGDPHPALSILIGRAGMTCWFRKDLHDRQSTRTGKCLAQPVPRKDLHPSTITSTGPTGRELQFMMSLAFTGIGIGIG